MVATTYRYASQCIYYGCPDLDQFCTNTVDTNTVDTVDTDTKRLTLGTVDTNIVDTDRQPVLIFPWTSDDAVHSCKHRKGKLTASQDMTCRYD